MRSRAVVANILGIDWGEKRIGLSFAESDLGIAFPLPALVGGSPESRLHALSMVVSQKKITELVIGYPYNMDGSAGFKTKEVDAFIELLLAKVDLPLTRIDERLSSHHAAALAKLSSPKRKTPQEQMAERKSGKLDSQAATLILQDYLDSHTDLKNY